MPYPLCGEIIEQLFAANQPKVLRFPGTEHFKKLSSPQSYFSAYFLPALIFPVTEYFSPGFSVNCG